MLLPTYYPNELDTLSLMEYVKYEQAFMFAYSMMVKHTRIRRCVQERNLEVCGTVEVCVSGG